MPRRNSDAFSKNTVAKSTFRLIVRRLTDLCFTLSTLHSSTASSFSRETPTRFEKELAKALSPNGTVEVTQLNHFLVNIGRPDTLVSDAEFKNLLEEVGSRNRYIDTIAMLKRLVQ
jgi:hypothetical protein